MDWCTWLYGREVGLGCICNKVCKPYFVTMKDVTTGEVVVCKMDWTWEEGSEFLWSEGNWSCDCNRLYEFRENKGLERIPDDDRSPYCKCSHVFQILGIRLADGTLVYEEEEAPKPRSGEIATME